MNIGFLAKLPSLMGMLQVVDDLMKDFQKQDEKFDPVLILGPESTAMIKKNEDKIFHVLQSLDLDDDLKGALQVEEGRENLLLALYVFVLAGEHISEVLTLQVGPQPES